MCGIAGQIKYKGVVDYNQIEAMNNAQRHRGPDGEGVYINAKRNVGLGHRRLSFLDLSTAGKQPMTNNKGYLHITYNGEIYNYLELRKLLEAEGCIFHSHTDTEVILNGYEKWGVDVLSKLKGMFALAIWCEREQQLFLARDRFGIKPLYYYTDENCFAFASEIKGLKANQEITTTLCFSSFSDFFVYRYVPSPNTIWKEVKKLPAAHYLILNSSGKLTIKQYWQIPFNETVISDKEAIEKFDSLLTASVRTHVRSDVPVGAFLSGGYDSAAIVYYMSKIGYTPSTYSIGFADWEGSEHVYAEMVARKFNTNHHSLVLESQSLDELEHLAWVYDEPNGDISIIPTYLVSREAAKYVKAVMGGEGSDEMLMGYQWQKDYKFQKRNFIDWLLSGFSHTKKNYILSYYANAMAMGRFDRNELEKLMAPEIHQHIRKDTDWYYRKNYNEELPDLKAIQVMDIKHFMGELVLAKVDRASMANSLEVRVPFLDHEICEFVFQLSTNVYYRKEETKHLLYQNIKNSLPQEILTRKKQGFVGPDRYYMNIEWYRSKLTESKLVADGIVNAAYVKSLLDSKDHWRLWKVTVMELWYRKWCK
jgi:asparagine synthase (glutamine-hydrolysing)